jgi:hypothetical protein
MHNVYTFTSDVISSEAYFGTLHRARLSSCPARMCFVLVILSCPVLVGPGLVLVVLFTFVQNVTYDGYFKIYCFGIDFMQHITIKICMSLPFPRLKS